MPAKISRKEQDDIDRFHEFMVQKMKAGLSQQKIQSTWEYKVED